MNNGTLYLIPSPIGNLQDISPRIKDTILLCDIIACEDTRNTQKLLNIIGIKKPCISCHEHNETVSSQNIISILKEGKNVGYLSDAGYPCISDPGYLLSCQAIAENITVTPISGPSAFLNALVASGLDCTHFMFYGFLQSKSSDRKKELLALKPYRYTLIFYEAPHRISDTLKDIYDVFGNRKIAIAREISKLHEEFIRTNLKTITEENKELIGELVIVLEGNSESEETQNISEIELQVNKLIENGINKKDAIKSVSIINNIPINQIKKIFY